MPNVEYRSSPNKKLKRAKSESKMFNTKWSKNIYHQIPTIPVIVDYKDSGLDSLFFNNPSIQSARPNHSKLHFTLLNTCTLSWQNHKTGLQNVKILHYIWPKLNLGESCIKCQEDRNIKLSWTEASSNQVQISRKLGNTLKLHIVRTNLAFLKCEHSHHAKPSNQGNVTKMSPKNSLTPLLKELKED